MKVNRENLLQKLESVRPGLSVKEIVEQSSCFVFKNQEVMTFNDEVACRISCKVNGLEGAIPSAPLFAILGKMVEDEIEVTTSEEEILLSGKRREAGIRMEKEITLPIHLVEKPKKWTHLHEDFSDAVTLVQDCAGKDETKFVLTCVHIHPKWMEACDNFQITRYTLDTGVKKPVLIKKESLKHIVSLGMIEFSETESWMHFRNSNGLILSCRRYVEDFPDLSKFLDVEGVPASLPKGLADAAERAEVFSAENVDNNQVLVELRPGKLRVKGQGVTGWYREMKSLKYKGSPLSFMVSPHLLVELTKRYNTCHISADRLKVDGGKFVYVSCLGKVGEEQ